MTLLTSSRSSQSTCYKSLREAVGKAGGAPITVAGTVTVDSPIRTSSDISIVGDSSCGGKPVIQSSFEYVMPSFQKSKSWQ